MTNFTKKKKKKWSTVHSLNGQENKKNRKRGFIDCSEFVKTIEIHSEKL